MALNASGPISLGGSTAGQSVNLELGQSATATVSFNDTSVRTLTGTSSGASLSMPAGFWGKSNATSVSTYLAKSFTVSASNSKLYGPIPTGIAVNKSTKDIYSVGYFYDPNNGSGIEGIYVQKINSAGSAVWTNKYYTPSAYGTYDMSSVAGTKYDIDSSGNVYILGQTAGVGYFVLCINSSGTLVWAKDIYANATYPTGTTCGVAVSPTDDIYVVMGSNTSTNQDYTTAVIKFNTAGTVQWKQILSAASATESFCINKPGSVSTDSAGNLYFGASVRNSADSTYIASAVKMNSSGTVQWACAYTPYPSIRQGTTGGLVLDSADNLYIAATLSDGGFPPGYNGGLIKINSSTGILSAQTGLSLTNGFVDLAIDSANNLYALGSASSGSFLVAQYSTSLGSPTWQRNFATTSSSGMQDGYTYGRATSATYITNTWVWAPPTTGGPAVYGSVTYQLLNSGAYTGTSTFTSTPVSGTLNITTVTRTTISPGYSTFTYTSTVSASTLTWTISTNTQITKATFDLANTTTQVIAQ